MLGEQLEFEFTTSDGLTTMICQICHGTGRHTTFLPCPECHGMGLLYCCDGLHEQPPVNTLVVDPPYVARAVPSDCD